MVYKRKIIAATKEKGEYQKWEIKKISDNFLASVLEALQRGEDVNMSGFGRFELKVQKARKVIHPKTKQPVHIPECPLLLSVRQSLCVSILLIPESTLVREDLRKSKGAKFGVQ